MVYIAVPSLPTKPPTTLRNDTMDDSDFNGNALFLVGQSGQEDDEEEPLTFHKCISRLPKALGLLEAQHHLSLTIPGATTWQQSRRRSDNLAAGARSLRPAIWTLTPWVKRPHNPSQLAMIGQVMWAQTNTGSCRLDGLTRERHMHACPLLVWSSLDWPLSPRNWALSLMLLRSASLCLWTTLWPSWTRSQLNLAKLATTS